MAWKELETDVCGFKIQLGGAKVVQGSTDCDLGHAGSIQDQRIDTLTFSLYDWNRI